VTSPRHGRGQEEFDHATLAAHIISTLAAEGKPVTLRQVKVLWEQYRPDDSPAVAARNVRRALERLHNAHVIVWRGSNRVRVRSELLLRVAAEQWHGGHVGL